MKYTIVEGKTVDEAINAGLLELEVGLEEVEVEVLEEGSKGLFGLIGSKDSRVKLTLIRDNKALAHDFLSKIISSMDISVDIELEEKDDSLLINITNVNSRDKGILIGKRGNTLDALQYLISLYINRGNEEYVKIILDIEGYREKREETLIRLAKRMADTAIRNRRKVKLEPMNPYERRIIHSSLQDYKGVTTYSEGKDPYRRIVIEAE